MLDAKESERHSNLRLLLDGGYEGRADVRAALPVSANSWLLSSLRVGAWGDLADKELSLGGVIDSSFDRQYE